MGGNVVTYFLKWVESAAGGGDRNWVNNHIHSIIHIGSPLLGVPKSFSSLLSGEMKDTAELAAVLDYWRQRVIVSQRDVRDIMRSFRSVPVMLPKGGEAVWVRRNYTHTINFCTQRTTPPHTLNNTT